MKTRTLRRFLILGLCFYLWIPAVAEISTGPTGTMILGTITEGPDPVGIWLQYRPLAPNQVFNASGHARGDGIPDIKFKAITDDPNPVGVWAYNAGTDHDIAFSEWDGGQWTPTAFLTSSPDDELDPRLAIEADGKLHVVWWTAGAIEKVYLATRPAGSAVWDLPVLVTGGGETGRRPSIAVDPSGLRVAYERDSSIGGMAQDVVVATKQAGDSFTLELVGSTVRTDRLDVMVHSEETHLWLDWMHGSDEFGCAEWRGSNWSPIAPEPWSDPSWVGIEGVRKAIRNQVSSH